MDSIVSFVSKYIVIRQTWKYSNLGLLVVIKVTWPAI